MSKLTPGFLDSRNLAPFDRIKVFQRYPALFPLTSSLAFPIWQKELSVIIKVKDAEMRRLSWIIPAVPN